MKTRKQGQQGFTLVEIAIVLVIIGLLLGGVLRGQELIDSGKSRQVVNDFNSLTAAYYSYQDRYRAVPGDDRVAHGFQNAGTLAGASDGIVTNATPLSAVSAVNTEGGAFWAQLRNAGFVKGATDTTATANAQSINAFDLRYGARQSAGVLVGTQPISSNNIICTSVPTKAAQAIDSNLDDGLPNSGSVRATNGVANANPGVVAALYDSSAANAFYSVCKAL